MTALKALIWDVDGTLADTERDGHRVAFNAAFEEFGLDWHWSVELYGELLAVTGGKERMRHYVGQHAINKPDAELNELIPRLHARKTEHFVRRLEDGEIGLRPGVERILAQARQEGVRLAIATTTTPANVEALLKATLGAESLAWFEVIAAGDIVPAKKPAPDIYHYALAQLALPASSCLALEDSAQGVRAARGANLPTVVTVSQYTRGDDFADALVVLDQFGETAAPCRILQSQVPVAAPADGCVDLAWLHSFIGSAKSAQA